MSSTKEQITHEAKEIGFEIFEAILNEEYDLLESIICSGLVNVNEPSPEGSTPLHVACE